MRKLDSDEQLFVGAFALMVLLCGLPFTTFMDLTKKPLEDWGQSMIDNKRITKENIQEPLIWLILYYGRVFTVFGFMVLSVRITEKLGYDMKLFPVRWRKYLATKHGDKL